MPTLRSFLVDGDGEYILSDPADPNSRIMTDEYIYGVSDTSWQRVASSVKACGGVKSFHIRHKESDDKWQLMINKHQHIGIYPSQDAAIQVLIGLFICVIPPFTSFCTHPIFPIRIIITNLF